MDMEALYAQYMTSARRGAKTGMKAYWNQTVAQALAYALGIEEVPPSEQEFARLMDYYGKAMMVSSQQEFDAFAIRALKALVDGGSPQQAIEAPLPEDTSPTLEKVGLPNELVRALSRHGVTTLSELFTKEFTLTKRQATLLKEAISKHLDRPPKGEESPFEVDFTDTA